MITRTTSKILIGVCTVIFSLTYSVNARPIPDWTFAIFMEAGMPAMSYWIYKNVNAMATAHSNAKCVNIVTQVHLEKTEAWRYLIRRGAIKPIENTAYGVDCGQNIIDFMQWTVKHYPAKHYGLILWGSGFGILDPTYNPTSTDSFAWDVEPDEPGHECVGGVCPLKMINFLTEEHSLHRALDGVPLRGLLFNDAQGFINNTAMVAALKAIKETVLKGKKLDILGTDCCKMAMLEVGYQIKDFANFLIGSQNCELKDGWNYEGLFGCFNGQPLDPLAVVNAIIQTYGTYYEKNTIQNTYTLSALDLSQMDPLVANLNTVVDLSKKLMAEQQAAFKALLLNARSRCPSMCQASYYLDLGAVYDNLLMELCKPEAGVFNAEVVVALKNVLTQGQALIKSVVAAKVGGTVVAHFQGVSIYFPRNRIDASYLPTPFAQETAWLSFLQEVVGQ